MRWYSWEKDHHDTKQATTGALMEALKFSRPVEVMEHTVKLIELMKAEAPPDQRKAYETISVALVNATLKAFPQLKEQENV